MIIIESVDTSGLSEFIRGFQKALQITSKQAVDYQTGLLMGDLMRASAPRKLSEAVKKSNWQVRKSFYAVKRGADIKKFGGDKPLFSGQKTDGKKTNTIWLYASKTVLVGVPAALDMRTASTEQLLSEHQKQKDRFERRRWLNVGKRGKKKVMLLNKPLIKAASARALSKKISDQYGKLKASFLKGVEQVRAHIVVHEFVKRHLYDSQGGFIPSNAQSLNPVTTIISRSPGCEHEKELRVIRAAVKKRTASLKKDLDLYLNGTKKAADFRNMYNLPHYTPNPEYN